MDRPAEARVVLGATADMGPTPPEIAPLWHWRHPRLAMNGGDRAQARRRAEDTQIALGQMGPDAVPEHRIMAHHGPAKFWPFQGGNPPAFANRTAGHALLRQIQPFSWADHLAFIEASTASLTPEWYASGHI